jgi:CubicO group peptidase (beta-lactamase class C family)/beta-lactamase regulating signal transducer with metallopeptidase domain
MISALAETFLSASLTSLWLGALLALAVGLLLRSVPLGPRARYHIWFLVLGVSLLAPLGGIGSPPDRGGQFSAARDPGALDLSRQEMPAVAADSAEAAGLSLLPSGETPEVFAADFSPAFPLELSWGRVLLLVWLGGSVVSLAWVGFQLFRLVGLKRTGSSPTDSLNNIWRSAFAESPGSRSVQLLLSDRAHLPSACGYFRPAVIAPAAICRALSDEETRHLLLHELAHLRRYDDWGLLLHRTVRALWWWHPIVWFIGSRLDAERELACDEEVVIRATRRDYARTLVRVAEMSRGTGLNLAPGVLKGDLTRRVESLLRAGRTPGRTTTRVGAGVAALSVLGVALWVAPPGVRISAAPAPGGSGPTPSVSEWAGAYLDSVFTGFADSGFSGSVLVALGDEIVLSRGYGLADRERGVPATADTRYSVAGFTKMFTAAGILLLETEGKLDLRQPVGLYLDPPTGKAGSVTPHQLLTHTDGLTRLNAPVYRQQRDDFVQAIATTPENFAPGQGYRYNDFGHSLLGVVVERVSGQDYESFVRDRFLTPAGLTSTGFESDRTPIAIEYAGRNGTSDPIPPRAYTWGRRASLGMVSTVGDMYRWLRALQDPRIVPAEVYARMLETHGRTDWGVEQGYGWDHRPRRSSGGLWQRVAGTPGMEGEILHDPVRNWTAVILVNSRIGWRYKVWGEIERLVDRAGTP